MYAIIEADGKQYRVKHPDYVAISPKGGRITVYADEETSTMISALHMVAVEPQRTRLPKGRRIPEGSKPAPNP